MKKYLIIILICSTFHSVDAQVLGVSQVIQEQTEWCWAAVTSCILDYYCTPTPQCVIAEYTRSVATWHNFGSTDCCLDPNLGCNYWNYNWGYAGSMQDILQYFGGITTSGSSGALSQIQIASDLASNRVFMIRWGWNTGGGHFIVGHGMIGDNIFYMDPWFGEGLKVATYAWVNSGGGHTWTHTNRLIVSPNSKPLAADSISGPDSVCQGHTAVTYHIPSIANATSYVWSLPAGASGSSTSQSIVVDFGGAATSGNISVYGSNTCGDGAASVFPITVNPTPPNPVITLNGMILQSDAPQGNQWYDQNGLIPGATGQYYTITANGYYYVIVCLAACCSGPSNTISMQNAGMDDQHGERQIRVFPNPASTVLTIELENNRNKLDFEILDSGGQVVFRGEVWKRSLIPVSGLAPGLYLVKIRFPMAMKCFKFIKE